MKFILGCLSLAVVLTFSMSSESLAAKRKKQPEFQCIPRKEIEQKAKECNDNEAYADAAVKCLNKLKALVDEKTKEAKTQLQSSVDESTNKNSQTQSTQGAANNYQISQQVLANLIQSAKQARLQVSNYLKDIVVPDEIALVEAGLDIDEVLLSEPCYAENQEVLLFVEEDIYKIIDELEASKNKSSALKSNSMSKKNSYSTKTKGAITSGKGQGAKLKGSKKVKPESDISGTEEKNP